MNRRLVIATVSAAAVLGAVAPSFAQSLAQSSPVTVHTSTDNGVSVGVDVNNSPGAGVAVRNGQVCAGLGEDIPFCTPPVTIVGPHSRQQLPPSPVVVRHDDNGTVVAVGDVGVVISNNGEVCPRVSTQEWICVNLG